MRSSSGESRRSDVVPIPDVSTTLIDFGIATIKKNPVPTGAYIIGVLICLLFSGTALTLDQSSEFNKDMRNIDYEALGDAYASMEASRHSYSQSKGYHHFLIYFLCNLRITSFSMSLLM